MLVIGSVVSACLSLSGLSQAQAATGAYTATVTTPVPTPIDLGTLGGTSSFAFGVSGDVVVGYSY
ncbi:hypothetical protein, partial [Nocardioides szechwanensis]